MPDLKDLDGWLASLLKPTPAEQFAELEAVRRAAPEAPPPEPSIIPPFVSPYPLNHPRAGVLRFPCALACGWFHEEWPGAEPLALPPIPVSAGTVERSRILTEHATACEDERKQRIEDAIRAHFNETHPGQEPPARTCWGAS
ncbi:hypothetical protein HEP81_04699 [Streptomyces griseofuscus]|uniref:Uncharacterized protein n=1 Tax=Streptomyces griseofuscus TaxID=146922 RepID=A0A7H1Q3U1_9ACTN|nr:hypothetical protein [Streptomyces griseofuscus]QNT94971.1 hypothetical protein HEP81_04699 [Streptomyces griseofuscus]